MKLSAERITIGYSTGTVGRDLSFEIAEGAVTMLLGPNGCGKSTLLRTLLGTLPLIDGTILLDGVSLASWHRGDLARQIAYVPQSGEGYFAYSVLDMVLLGRAPHIGLFAAPGRRDIAVAETAMDAVGIGHLAQRDMNMLSGGQRQLVLIARALAQGCNLLVMDEPTASLDFTNQHRILSRIRSIATGGNSVIVSSHNPDHAFQYADRVLVLHDGNIVANGPPESALTADCLREVYEMPISVVDIETGGDLLRRCLPG